MPLYSLNHLLSRKNSNERLTREFSLNEFVTIYGNFKHQFQEQLQKPTADNNFLINYDLQCKNLIQTSSFIQMILAGSFTYSIKYFVGHRIDNVAFKMFGESKGRYAQIAFYIGSYIYLSSYLSNVKGLDINHIINPREKQGEIMLQIIMNSFPHKVDHQKYVSIMKEKNIYQISRTHQFNQMLESKSQPIKISQDNISNVESLISNYNKQINPLQNSQQQQQNMVQHYQEQKLQVLQNQIDESKIQQQNQATIKEDQNMGQIKQTQQIENQQQINIVRQQNKNSPYLNTTNDLILNKNNDQAFQNVYQTGQNFQLNKIQSSDTQQQPTHSSQNIPSQQQNIQNNQSTYELLSDYRVASQNLKERTGHSYQGVYSNVLRQSKQEK